MKTDMYLKLQKKFGGKWVATSKSGRVVYAKGDDSKELFADLKKHRIPPKRTAIGYIEKYGQISAYSSLSVQKH